MSPNTVRGVLQETGTRSLPAALHAEVEPTFPLKHLKPMIPKSNNDEKLKPQSNVQVSRNTHC